MALFHREITKKMFEYDSGYRFEFQRNIPLYFIVENYFSASVSCEMVAHKGTERNPFTDMAFGAAGSARNSNARKRKELSSESRLPIIVRLVTVPRLHSCLHDKLDRRGGREARSKMTIS